MSDLGAPVDIATMPKVELHVHLNGSISEATASSLARRHGADPREAGLVDGRYPGRYDDFGSFLDTYLKANSFVRTPDDLEVVAAEFARAQAAQSIAYSEAIFTAMIPVRNGMEPAGMWRALRNGLTAGGPETRINLIVDTIRDLGPDEARATLQLVEEADAPIVGLCITGAAETYAAEGFAFFSAAADRLDMGMEVHAGELGPPAGVVEAIDRLGADRIGHGVRAIEDPLLVQRLVREAIPLDVCPSSNVRTGLYPSIADHPVAPFWRAGVNVTVSSDDPPFFDTTLTNELEEVARVAQLSRADLVELQRRAIRNSFAAAADRQAVINKIDAWANGDP